MSLTPNYDSKQYEDDIYVEWMRAGVGSPEAQSEIQNSKFKIQNDLKSEPPAITGERPTGTQYFTKDSEISSPQTYTILMPPPNLTGELHAGHAFQHYLMDTLTRIHRQKGEKSLWYPGVDHAGIQMEGVLGKLLKEQGKQREDLSDEEFLEFAWQKAEEWRNRQQEQASILGDTPDYGRQLFTLDERATNMVNLAFRKYWQDGLIYKGSYLINWSVGLQTALSDVSGEIEYEKRVDPFVTFEYRLSPASGGADEVDGGGQGSSNQPPHPDKSGNPSRGAQPPSRLPPDSLQRETSQLFQKLYQHFVQNPLLVSTVRPETIFGDVAVAIHPRKLREKLAKDFASGEVEQIVEKISKGEIVLEFGVEPLGVGGVRLIVAQEVDPDFGTGVLKITPASDMHDYEIFQKYLGGDFPQAVGRDGRLTEVCGRWVGLSVEEGRYEVLKTLLEEGYVPGRG